MKGMSKFQLILTGIFGAFILIGVLVFAFGQSSSTSDLSTATVWGTMNASLFENFMTQSGLSQDKTIQVTYVEKRKETFDQEFIEALAVGAGPDLFFLPQDSILKNQDKIYTIPFSVYKEGDFTNTFVEEGELFLTSKGVLAFPFLVDPMVMYWNRDTFSNAGLSVPPKYWSEMYDLSVKLTQKDTNFNISKSAIALGEHSNITNANEILSLLTLQAGNPITTRGADGVSVNNLFAQRFDFPVAPASAALNFYTEFANPLKPFYSWNRSLPSSKEFFLSGDLAMYFGFASELPELRLKNPNLNFAVAAIPQSKDAARITTFGRMVGLAITKNSKNPSAALQVALKLTDAQSISSLVKVTNLPPVRRDLLTTRPSEAFLSVFYDGAVQAKAWLAPEPTALSPIFKEMVESVTAGRAGVSGAVSKTGAELDVLLP